MTARPIRDAATVILTRDGPGGPRVLMGQRGSTAAFMPNKVVFPGGAVDPGDSTVALAGHPGEACLARLREGCGETPVSGLLAAAVREVWEETGLALGTPAPWPDPPADWQGFAATGLRPSAQGLTFVFRAITPPGRPRRFDARFFLADADAVVAGDPDDFSHASDELSALEWIPLAEVRSRNLPFITEVVLAEVTALLAAGGGPPESVPFFHNDDEATTFRRLHGVAPPGDP